MINNILPYRQELFRKLIHLTALVIPFCIHVLIYPYNLIFLFSSTFILLVVDYCRLNFNFVKKIFNYFLSNVIRAYEENSFLSGTYMLLSFSAILLFFDIRLCIIAMSIAIVSDTVAAVFGIKYGKIILINQKTLEGSYSFFISTILILFFFNYNLSIPVLFTISFLSTVTELFSPTKYDNFTLPIVNVILLFWLL